MSQHRAKLIFAVFAAFAEFERELIRERTRARMTAAMIAHHASTRTTQLYDRRNDEVSLDEVERILI